MSEGAVLRSRRWRWSFSSRSSSRSTAATNGGRRLLLGLPRDYSKGHAWLREKERRGKGTYHSDVCVERNFANQKRSRV